MIVKRIVRKDSGEVEATLMLTGEQAAFLMNVGLGALVQRGVVTLQDFSPEAFEQHMQEQGQVVEGETQESATGPVTAPVPAPADVNQAETTVTPVGPSEADMKSFLENVNIELLHKA